MIGGLEKLSLELQYQGWLEYQKIQNERKAFIQILNALGKEPNQIQSDFLDGLSANLPTLFSERASGRSLLFLTYAIAICLVHDDIEIAMCFENYGMLRFHKRQFKKTLNRLNQPYRSRDQHPVVEVGNSRVSFFSSPDRRILLGKRFNVFFVFGDLGQVMEDVIEREDSMILHHLDLPPMQPDYNTPPAHVPKSRYTGPKWTMS